MDTYSQALYNYHKGIPPDTFEIIREDGYASEVPVSVFFDDKNFSDIELLALNQCKGKVLDIGAGAGRHSLELQRRGLDVTALDRSKQAVQIMKERGIHKTIAQDIMDLTDTTYDTLLLLMNGIGMAGNSESIDKFLNQLHSLLNTDGTLIVDSLDVFKTSEPIHVHYREKNRSQSKYPGEQKLRVEYDNDPGEWFTWLHLSYEELSMHALNAHFSPTLISMDEGGHYLAQLRKV